MKKILFPMLLVIAVLHSCQSDEEKKAEAAINMQPPNELLSENSGKLIELVNAASDRISAEGVKFFDSLKTEGSRWRREDNYIFVIDSMGNMLVHPDTSMEGKNQESLKDLNGKLITKGLLATAINAGSGAGGWYHYQWQVPGGLFPRWKSSYVKWVTDPSGKSYAVGSGIYTESMEKAFVVDMVSDAVKQIELNGENSFSVFRDKTDRFLVKDAYVFVIDSSGNDIVNPAFPALEGRNIMEIKDTEGKYLVREMFSVVDKDGSGWVDYMWPRPGQSVSSIKSTFVSKARYNGKTYLVGCGVYLEDAKKATAALNMVSSDSLVKLVNQAAAVFEQQGERAYPEFRKKESKWFRGDNYFFVWSPEGKRIFHAANPAIEGEDVKDFKDALDRPIGRMILETGSSAAGEGWVHYIYPEPGSIFPIWKSSYIKRVAFPSGKKYIIGCGIYNMALDKPLIEDLVNRAAIAVEKQGKKAFPMLRDKTGPFVFMDTYIFMISPEGVEMLNAAVPALEGKNILDAKDLKGNNLIRDEIALAMKEGKGWIDGYWYRPGDNRIELKHTFVRKVQCEGKTCIIGSGFYPANQ